MNKDKDNTKNNDSEIKTIVPFRMVFVGLGILLLKFCQTYFVEDEDPIIKKINDLQRSNYHYQP